MLMLVAKANAAAANLLQAIRPTASVWGVMWHVNKIEVRWLWHAEWGCECGWEWEWGCWWWRWLV